jgi:hypothetical protein
MTVRIKTVSITALSMIIKTVTLSVSMLNVMLSYFYCYAECRYNEFHYAECYGTFWTNKLVFVPAQVLFYILRM